MRNLPHFSFFGRRAFLRVSLTLVASLVLCAVPGAAAPRLAELSVEILDVGQGDSILIRSPEGKTALVDAGPSKAVAALLKQKGVTSIDLIVLSHHHSDHYGGMAEVIRTFKPKVFLATNSSHTTSSYLKLLQLVRDEGIRSITPTATVRKIGLGSVVLNVLPQPPDNTQEENDNSIGIRVEYGNFSAIMTGDSEERSRAYWEKTCPNLLKDCTILKLAHHGSRNGTDAKWLDMLRPEQAVVSLGTGNDYGHPHAETISLLDRKRLSLLRTDLVGTITIVSDGKTWDVTTAKKSRGAGSAEIAAAPKSKGRSRPKTATASKSSSSKLVDLNNATAAELMEIPGIGPSSAKKIIAGRPYDSHDDLHKLKGLGEARIAELESSTVVR